MAGWLQVIVLTWTRKSLRSGYFYFGKAKDCEKLSDIIISL